MRRILFWMLLAHFGWAAPVPSNATAIRVTHGSAIFEIQSTESFLYSRIRFGETLSYEAGAGGGIQGGTGSSGIYSASNAVGKYRVVWITGLKPSTLYYACVQVTNDVNSWSACATTSFTTSAAPATHPEPPIAATEVPATRPDFTGWTKLDVASNCSDLQTQLTQAAVNQASSVNTVVVIPSTTVCGPFTVPYSRTFRAVTFDHAANTVTLSSHGYASNTKVRFATNSGSLPAEIVAGNDYYVISVNSSTFKVSATAGPGTEVDFTSSGSGSYVLAWPPTGGKVVLTSDRVYAGTFLPDGVKITEEWDGAMPNILMPQWPNATTRGGSALTFEYAVHDWSAIGIKFSAPNTAATQILTTTDPDGYWYAIGDTKRSNANIMFSQCWFYNPPWPSRTDRWFTMMDGENMAIVNNLFSNMSWWTPRNGGGGSQATEGNTFGAIYPYKQSATVAKMSAGTYYFGAYVVQAPTDIVVTLTGGTNTCTWNASFDGCVIFYLDIGAHLKVVIPTGMTATCTGYADCTVVTSASPAMPFSNGRIAGAWIGVASLTSGQFNQVAPLYLDGHSELGPAASGKTHPEGSSAIIVGTGPGPFTFRNNTLYGTGTPLIFDDSFAFSQGLYRNFQFQDLVVKRNLFSPPDEAWAALDGTKGIRGHRQMLEAKSGRRFLVQGNIIEHSYASNHRTSDMLWTAIGSDVTDVDIRSNVMRLNGLNGPDIVQSANFGHPAAHVVERVRVENNLFYGNNAWTGRYAFRVLNPASGIAHPVDNGVQDYNFNHNTYWDFRGAGPYFLRRKNGRAEGFSITNNVIFNSATQPISSEDGNDYSAEFGISLCTGATSKLVADCFFQRGPGVPDLTFAGNVLVPGYSETQTPSGAIDPAAMCTTLGGTWSSPNCTGGMGTANKIVPGTTVADRTVALGMVGTGALLDLTLKYTSAYLGKDVPTTDGKDPGVDAEELKRDIGLIDTPRVIAAGTTTATIAATVYDGALGQPCTLAYGTQTTPPSWTNRVANTTASKHRTWNLSGLSTGVYYYQVWCRDMTPTKTAQLSIR